MPPFDDQAAHLPPPRADEPANLRREIIDELSDHLTCARKREQLAGGSQTEEAIRNRILDRFGDPAAVARKLWLDWMWEKIMTQRILTAVCILLTVVTCTALAFAWVSVNHQQDLIADLQLSSQSQLEQQQKQFERLLAAAQSNKAPSDWNPVELRFVKGKEDGPPAEGIKVTVSIRASETGLPPRESTANEQGIVRFDRVRYGMYTVTAENTANEKLTTNFTLQPGQSLTRTIVCPDPPAEPIRLFPRIAWPDDLASRPIWFRFKQHAVFREVSGKQWQPPVPLLPVDAGRRHEPGEPLVGPTGDLGAYSWNGLRAHSPRMTGVSALIGDRYQMIIDFDDPFQDRRVVQQPQGINWPGENYRIHTLHILIQDEHSRLSPSFSIDEIMDATPIPHDSLADRGGHVSRRYHYFTGIDLPSADWSYRIEPGIGGKPGTLWLTPTAEAIQKVRTALTEIDQAREAAKKAEAAAEKARRQSEPRETNSDVAKENADSK